MKYVALLCIILSAAYAQSYNPGLRQPGLPNSLGQKTMANSTSVTIASNQSAVPITGTITASNPSVGTNNSPAPSSSTLIGYRDGSGNLIPFPGNSNGITVSATQGTSPWVTSRDWLLRDYLDSVGVTGTVTSNQGTSPWVTSRNWLLRDYTDSVGVTGTVTSNQGTSPWVTSRNWNLNSSVDSVAVTGTVTSTQITATASSVSRVANSASSQTLLSANGSRKGVFLYNDAATAACYVKFGATATTTSFTVKMFATDTYIMDPPVYTGVIDYICDAASGSMEVSEL